MEAIDYQIAIPFPVEISNDGIVVVFHYLQCLNCLKQGEEGYYEAWVRMDFVNSDGKCFASPCPRCGVKEVYIITYSGPLTLEEGSSDN